VTAVFHFLRELISSRPLALRSSRLSGVAKRFALVGLSFLSMTACTDMTGPKSADQQAIDNLMPAVTDARFRLAGGVGDIAARQQVILAMSNLELALRAGDISKTRSRLGEVTTLLNAYRAKTSASDAADISAMFLTLHAVSEVVQPSSVIASP